jgi:hypothetical protein
MGNFRDAAIVSAFALLMLPGCLELKSNPTAYTAFLRAQGQAVVAPPVTGCVTDKTRAMRALAARVEVKGSEHRAEGYCTQPSHYSCSHRQFSPDLPNRAEGTTQTSECADDASLGGKVCLTLASHRFNTREAARNTGADKSAIEPGGEFNRDEYLCHHVQLKDKAGAVAIGEAENLTDALKLAHEKCQDLVPFLQEH